jgi:predicted chitinase
MTHFLGQGAHESAQLNGMIERGNTSGSRQPEVNGWYDNPAETYFNMYRDRNGNIESRDGIKFRGRGMKQLTGRSNYGYYWAYRGWIRQTSFSEPWWSPARIDRAPAIENPQFAGNDAYTTIDAGGWYWESTPIRGLSNGLGRPSSSINVLLDRNPHSDDLVRLVARQINGGEIGLPDRRFQTQRVHEILRDG